MNAALRAAFPNLSPDQIEQLAADAGVACPRCARWVELEALIEPGGPRCTGCLTRIQLRRAADDSTWVLSSAALREQVGPLGQPSDGTLPAPSEAGDGTIPERIGRYLLHGLIGRGGMGVVWRAFDPELQRVVAVKILHAGRDHVERERFRREARIAAALDHPAIVRTLDVGTEGQDMFIVQEFVDGISLAQRLEDWQPSVEEAIELVIELAGGIAFAHDAGVIHRDLKPGNVLIQTDPQTARIADFGLARRQTEQSDLSVTGQILGTPRYLAPEMLREQRSLSPAVDIYGLGTILYELLTGRPPIRGHTLEQILLNVSQGVIEPTSALNPRTPRPIEAVCMKCLSHDPESRYPSAHALIADLRRVLAGQPIQLLLPVTGLSGTVLAGLTLARQRLQTGQGVLYESVDADGQPRLALVQAGTQPAEPAQWPEHPNIWAGGRQARTTGDYTVRPHPMTSVMPLSELLADGPLAPPLALAIIRQLLQALAAAHALELPHGALNPDVILLTGEGRPGRFVQLVPPASPGQDQASIADDLASVMRLLYQLLTGTQPTEDRLDLAPVPAAMRGVFAAKHADASSFVEALPKLVSPSPIRRAVLLTPAWMLLLYACFGVLVIQHPDGARTVRLLPARPQLAAGDRVLARGLIQWAMAHTNPLPPIGEPTKLPTLTTPALDRYRPYCKTRARARRAQLGRGDPSMSRIPARDGQPAFWIDRHEVTRAAYQQFLDDLERRFPEHPLPAPEGWVRPSDQRQARLPATGCSWHHAQLYATWAGKSLPTSQQWTIAATAARPDGAAILRTFPWGPTYVRKHAHHHAPGDTVPEGPMAADHTLLWRTDLGLVHMAGNVWEWVADAPPAAPRHRRIRGGGFTSAPPELSSTYWDAFRSELGRRDLGFRCVFQPAR